MTSPRCRAAALLWLPLVLAPAACAADSDGPETGDSSPVITLNDEANAWPDAEVTGTLELREGCLLIGDSVAVFAFGTTWRDSEVVFEDGTVAEVGSQVHMGGGWIGVDDVDQADLPIVPMDKVKACAKRTGVADFVWADVSSEPQGPA